MKTSYLPSSVHQSVDLSHILLLCLGIQTKTMKMQKELLSSSTTYSGKVMQRLLKHLSIAHKACQEIKPIKNTSRKSTMLDFTPTFGSTSFDQSDAKKTYNMSGWA